MRSKGKKPRLNICFYTDMSLRVTIGKKLLSQVDAHLIGLLIAMCEGQVNFPVIIRPDK